MTNKNYTNYNKKNFTEAREDKKRLSFLRPITLLDIQELTRTKKIREAKIGYIKWKQLDNYHLYGLETDFGLGNFEREGGRKNLHALYIIDLRDNTVSRKIVNITKDGKIIYHHGIECQGNFEEMELYYSSLNQLKHLGLLPRPVEEVNVKNDLTYFDHYEFLLRK